MTEKVNHPDHYNKHPSGVECITITEHMCFNLGNAIKYIWRFDLKNDAIEDLKKAAWYIDREIKRRENQNDFNDATLRINSIAGSEFVCTRPNESRSKSV